MSVSHRHLARRLAVQALYQWDLTGQSPDSIEPHFLTDAKPNKYDREYFLHLVNAVPDNVVELDNLLRTHLDRAIGSIDVVERAVLRLAAWEIKGDNVPSHVAINEAVELAKLYGSDNGYRFVNGVLDKLARSDTSFEIKKSTTVTEDDADSPSEDAHKDGDESAGDITLSTSIGEFDLIATHFQRPGRDGTLLSIGDDAAVLAPPDGENLVITVDTMVCGIHFLAQMSPRDVGHKVMAVNLSDLAAMGARPSFVTLAITMPTSDGPWLAEFSEGLFAMADQYNVDLVGGDTTRGPLSITIQAGGWVKSEHVLKRSGANAGDAIFVTGTVGDAALGLMAYDGRLDALSLSTQDMAYLRNRLDRPEPRVMAGIALKGVASSAIDISDGFTQDLAHLLQSSNVGATIDLDRLPLSRAYQACRESLGINAALSGGDDYELLFTVPANRAEKFAIPGLQTTKIGTIESKPGLRAWQRDKHGQRILGPLETSGYRHF